MVHIDPFAGETMENAERSIATIAMAPRAGRVRTWWRRKTVHPGAQYDGHFFQRSVIRLSLLDRMLVAFGRNVVVETRTEFDAPADALERFGEMRTEAWTQPRHW